MRFGEWVVGSKQVNVFVDADNLHHEELNPTYSRLQVYEVQ
jgi:hypothetical protein